MTAWDALASTLVFLALGVVVVSWQYRRRPHQCSWCGYDLRGLASVAIACPECGRDRSSRRRTWLGVRPSRWLAVCTLMIAAVVSSSWPRRDALIDVAPSALLTVLAEYGHERAFAVLSTRADAGTLTGWASRRFVDMAADPAPLASTPFGPAAVPFKLACRMAIRGNMHARLAIQRVCLSRPTRTARIALELLRYETMGLDNAHFQAVYDARAATGRYDADALERSRARCPGGLAAYWLYEVGVGALDTCIDQDGCLAAFWVAHDSLRGFQLDLALAEDLAQQTRCRPWYQAQLEAQTLEQHILHNQYR